jgi:hypothetical protein
MLLFHLHIFYARAASRAQLRAKRQAISRIYACFLNFYIAFPKNFSNVRHRKGQGSRV